LEHYGEQISLVRVILNHKDGQRGAIDLVFIHLSFPATPWLEFTCDKKIFVSSIFRTTSACNRRLWFSKTYTFHASHGMYD